jgi:methylated-DNA-[protein]-cysteine S-methyltransferase
MNASLIAQARWTSPLGPMVLAATERGLAGAWFDGQKHQPAVGAPVCGGQCWIALAREQLAAYFAGRLHQFDLPLDLHGTPFQRAVWQALLDIAPGQTTSYRRLAEAIGTPAATRAVGAAVGRNPVSVIVPCHRVLGSDGSLTGYAGGLQRKTWLLDLEAALMSEAQRSMRKPQDPAQHGRAALTTVAA